MKFAIQISEKQFQKQVIDLAHLLNYRVAHFRRADTRRPSPVTAKASRISCSAAAAWSSSPS
jgi:hypothetical protein